MESAIQTVGEGAEAIRAVKTTMTTRNWQEWWMLRLSWQDGKALPRATVLRDADSADQTALSLPVGRVIFLFEPIVHGFQR